MCDRSILSAAFSRRGKFGGTMSASTFRPSVRECGSAGVDWIAWGGSTCPVPPPKSEATAPAFYCLRRTSLAVALSSTTRYLHLWTFDLDIDQAKISHYGLSSTITDQLKPWAGLE